MLEFNREIHGLREVEDIRLEKAIEKEYRSRKPKLQRVDKYLFYKLVGSFGTSKGDIWDYLATVLITREKFEDANIELNKLSGNMGCIHKRKNQSTTLKCATRWIFQSR